MFKKRKKQKADRNQGLIFNINLELGTRQTAFWKQQKPKSFKYIRIVIWYFLNISYKSRIETAM